MMNIPQKSIFPDIDQLHKAPSLELLLEVVPMALVTIDQAGQIVFVNARLEELFGYHRQELLGQKIELLLPARFRDVHRQHRAGYIAAPRTRTMGSGMNLAAQRKNGSEFPIEVGLSFFEINQEIFVIGSIIDITIRKGLAEILEQRVEERTREIEHRRQVADGLRETLMVINSNRSLAEILDYIVTHLAIVLARC
jgi:PAS domain S-box-containing protein